MVEGTVSKYVAMHSEKGPRKSNQDCAFAGRLENANGIEVWVVCVADGVGGGRHGEQAATLAVNSLCSLVKDSAFNDVTALKALVPQWIDDLNEAIKDIAGEDDSVNTTLSACLVSNSRSLVVHVGDTRVYVLDERSCRPITEDHNDANAALKSGVEEEFIQKSDFRALSRCLGTGIEEVEPDIHENILPEGQPCWIVATSDGTHEKVPSAAILQLARASQSARELAVDLVNWATKARTRDNATVAVLRIGPIKPNGKKPEFPVESTGGTEMVPDGRVIDSINGKRVGLRDPNRLLAALALMLIILAVPLLWYGLARRDSGDTTRMVEVPQEVEVPVLDTDEEVQTSSDQRGGKDKYGADTPRVHESLDDDQSDTPAGVSPGVYDDPGAGDEDEEPDAGMPESQDQNIPLNKPVSVKVSGTSWEEMRIQLEDKLKPEMDDFRLSNSAFIDALAQFGIMEGRSFAKSDRSPIVEAGGECFTITVSIPDGSIVGAKCTSN